MNLIETTKNVQRALPGVEVDGVPGMQTMLAVLHLIQGQHGIELSEPPEEQMVITGESRVSALDARTLKNIATLDPKARDAFTQFAQLADATAATMGCQYIMICGTRTAEEQAVLYAKCQAGGPHAVPPLYSWHNFKTAGDFGVFKNGVYLDDGNAASQALAEKVHLACSAHAAACGLEAGARWIGKSNDEPHYQINVGHSTPTDADRARFRAQGSVL